MKKVIIYAALFLMITATGLAQNKPFPQNQSWNGAIKPNHKTQDELNKAVINLYESWKNDFLKETILEGGYYVHGECTGCQVESKGTSEGHGYGMIITALMAGYDDMSKVYFDGFYKFFDQYRSTTNSELMNWNVAKDERPAWTGSATDGDFDIAYALLLAHYQWGSGGEINYLQEAIDMINLGLKAGDMSTQTKRVMLGDWDSNRFTTRPSDWMPDHFRAYASATNDSFWLEAADTIYSIIDVIKQDYSSVTGLMPDFVIDKEPRPAGANFLEGPHDGHYYYNACRYPWRTTSDFLHYNQAKPKYALKPYLKWASKIVENGFHKFTAGYTLDGTPFNNYTDNAFTAPLVLAFTTDPQYQSELNKGWDYIEERYSSYYDGSLNLLCQLLITGNWWAPAPVLPKEEVVGGKIIGYFPSWVGLSSVDKIQMDKLTHINYSFLLPNADGSLQSIENPDLLEQIVESAHQNSVKVSIAIGGWNGGDDSAFETLAADSAKTINFVSNVMQFIDDYNLDGVDMDWEYPESGSSADNFVSMMAVLADSLKTKNKLLTAAVIGKEWDKNAIKDSVFSLVDWLNIMAYDNGSESNHSTIDFAKSCLDYWQNTRSLPKEKTVLGVPFYSSPSYKSYRSLISQYPEAFGLDNVGDQFYNGQPTMNAKVEMAKERCAGTMIWEISQDAYDQETSLLTTIYETYHGVFSLATDVTGVYSESTTLGIYPNPANSSVNIELENGLKIKTVCIYNQCGSLVKQVNISNNTNNVVINIEQMKAGVYILKINDEFNYRTAKLLKH